MNRWMIGGCAALLVGAMVALGGGNARGFGAPELLVTNTGPGGPGSLADAMARANLLGRGARIGFAIPRSDPGFDPAAGVWRIAVPSALPPILAEGTVIEGESQARAIGDTNPAGPEIELAGPARAVDAGIALVAPNCRLTGLAIGDFQHGVAIYGAGAVGCEVASCHIGVAADGRTPRPNGAGVVIVEGARDNVVEKCLISGNATVGVYIGGRSTSGNALRRNLIGTDGAGNARVPNGLGVLVNRSSENRIGEAGAGNLVSGNANVGVLLVGKWTERNAILGDRIGTTADGTRPLPNNIGIVVKSLAHRNRIGGAAQGEGNVISGNVQIGVYIEASDGNVLHGNRIGTDPSGARIVEAGGVVQGNGVEFDTVSRNNVLGGDRPGERNLISGHKVYGVVYYGNCERNSTIGNYIGTDITGTKPLPNATGICVDCAAHDNLIARNVISGNMSYGLFFVTRGTEGNVLVGNRIGTTANGDAALPNDVGMCVSTGACRNRVGGPRPEDANVISGNTQAGLMITNQLTAENLVEGNLIGLDAAGVRPIPNKMGVLFSTHPERNTVRRNTISGNSGAGVVLYEYARENLVVANRIGIAATTDAGVPNGAGIVIDHWSAGNRVGRPGEPNLVRHNLAGGILVSAEVGEGNDVRDNVVERNGGVDVAVAPRRKLGTAGRPRVTLPAAPPAKPPARMAAVGAPPAGYRPNPSRRTFLVTNTRESGPGSYAAAVQACNAAGGHADIRFDLQRSDAGFDPSTGTWRIRLTDTPPDIKAPDVAVDGWSQTALRGDTNPRGPEIVLDGSDHTVEYAVCLNGATNSRVQGLVVGRFVVGIQVNGATAAGNRVAGCYVGVGPDGVSPFGNYNGIELVGGARGNVVGGASGAEANVVSGNEHVGIRLSDASENRVIGNLVGTDRTGRRAVRNYDGITLEGQSSGNVIGGSGPGEANVCSGNMAYGVDLFGWGVTRNRVIGNLIGTDVTGSRAVPNTYGVLFDDRSHHNVVGGERPGEGNVISGNTAFGAYFYNNGTHHNAFVGNRIGTDASGRYALPNETGVHIDGGTTDNRVDRNVISGNRVAGITIFSIKTDRNAITRNLIGTDLTGQRALGNGSDGVRIVFGACDNTIGGTREAGNTVACNGRAGIAIESPGSQRNRIVGNRIRGNAGLGIDLFPIGPNGTRPLPPAAVPNAGMPAPFIGSVVRQKGHAIVRGRVAAERAQGTMVHVYVGEPGPGGDVQGTRLLGTAPAGSDGSWVLRVAAPEPLRHVAATATDREGNTSEFGGWSPAARPRAVQRQSGNARRSAASAARGR